MESITFMVGSLCAKLTMPLTILVCIIFVLRIAGKKCKPGGWVNRLNRRLRKIHIPLGLHWYLCPDLGRVMPGFPCSNMPDMVFPQEKRIQLYEMASRFDSGFPHNLSPAPGRGSLSQSGKFL